VPDVHALRQSKSRADTSCNSYNPDRSKSAELCGNLALFRNGPAVPGRQEMASQLIDVLKKNEADILTGWMQSQPRLTASGAEVRREQAQQFLGAFREAVSRGGGADINTPAWTEARDVLGVVSRNYAEQGMTPTQTATFVFALKQPLFEALRKDLGKTPEALAAEIWSATSMLDQLGLYTTELHQQAHNSIIQRQQRELLELSTPVVRLWENILALPLVGTLDSARSQVVMEALLQRIVDTGAEIAIIDITGVPTVDTLVAQHLLKTIAATRLMGADCIISGIRPQIAQTIVHLGVDLGEVTTKATLADAFAVALKRTNSRLLRDLQPRTGE
jgi:rsbT co-antagonist protein RsbR